jgi:hypothetical protein
MSTLLIWTLDSELSLGLFIHLSPFSRVNENQFELYVAHVQKTFHMLLTRDGKKQQQFAGEFYKGALGRNATKTIMLSFEPNPTLREAAEQLNSSNRTNVALIAEAVSTNEEVLDLTKENIIVVNERRTGRLNSSFLFLVSPVATLPHRRLGCS